MAWEEKSADKYLSKNSPPTYLWGSEEEWRKISIPKNSTEGITAVANVKSQTLGKLLKKTYSSILPEKYSSSRVEMHSIASLRHTLTAQAVLYGMFPDKISSEVFDVIPQIFAIHTNEPIYDYLLKPTITCPLFETLPFPLIWLKFGS